MLRECDYSQALLEQVNQAISDKTPLVIQGSNSKAFLGRPVTGQTLDVRCHRGIVNYDPTELVITARAGTPLVAIEAALESAGQMLPCASMKNLRDCKMASLHSLPHKEKSCLPDSHFKRQKVIFAMRNFMRKDKPATTICWMAG